MSKQRIKSTQLINNNYQQDDQEFTSSCCDYNSDIFKEQPSQADFSRMANERQFINLDSDDEGVNENFVISPLSNKTPTTRQDDNGSLRMLNGNYNLIISKGHQGSRTAKQSSVGQTPGSNTYLQLNKQNQSKLSCEQSLLFNQLPMNSAVQTTKHKKQPLCSLIPQNINKNLSKVFNSVTSKSQNKSTAPQSIQMINNMKRKSRQGSSQIGATGVKTVNNENVNIMMCEESELLTMMKATSTREHVGNSSQTNLTPQKYHPVPISPSQKPILSQNTSNMNGQLNKQNANCVMCLNHQKSDLKQSTTNRAYNNSDQKPTVVYNEFKYYTTGNEINQQNLKNFIHISNSGFQRKSDIVSPQHQYELSPSDHKIFDISSPKNSISGGSNIRANSLRKQIAGITNQIQDNRNYQLQLKQLDSSQSGKSDYQQYESKIKELQDYIMNLEEDLKTSQLRNQEMQKKVKDKSFIQSFDKTGKHNKHLSDTEDSLILSEKKNFKRSSHNISKQPPCSSNHNLSQGSSSIVDVKIRPITNMKAPQQTYVRKNSSSLKSSDVLLQATEETLDQQDNIEYQVNNYHDESRTQLEIQEHQDCGEDQEEECEGCERLKQLVFQAKEAIDDLKAEIEEWREICAEKETELRQIQHKLYNDLVGVEKKIDFKDEVMTKEYDPARPPNIDSKRIRNYIEHNKKKIKSRSKTRQLSERKLGLSAKRTNLKHLKEAVTINDEEQEFYEAEDQGIQTSFAFDYMTTSHDHIRCKSELKVNPHYYVSNASTSQNLSPEKPSQIDNHLSSACDEKYQSNEMSYLQVQQQDELQSLRVRTQAYEQEIARLKGNIQQMSKQCEQFVSVVQKARRKGKKQSGVDIDELKKNYEIVSPLESYSILEKIQEWKREEGISNSQNDQQVHQTRIPRPLKLIMEITQEDISQQAQEPEEKSKTRNESPIGDFRNYIKQEQENLKKQQQLKFQELQKQQQEYLMFLRGQN